MACTSCGCRFSTLAVCNFGLCGTTAGHRSVPPCSFQLAVTIGIIVAQASYSASTAGQLSYQTLLVQCSHMPCGFLTFGLLHERDSHSSALCPSGPTAADQLGCGCLGDEIQRCRHTLGDRDSKLACICGQPASLIGHKVLRARAASGPPTTACPNRDLGSVEGDAPAQLPPT